jgi:HK97 family phage portal protein
MKIPFKPTTKPGIWDDYWYQHQGYDSKTGIDVNEDISLTYSAVWACVKVISEDLASLPLFVYKRGENSKEKQPNHPLYYLLHDAPNDEMSAMQFRECLQAHLLLWGNAYAEIQRDKRGLPRALWPLNPGRMRVEREANELVYEYTLTDTGEKRIFAKEDIFHIAGLGFNGLVGYSPIGYQREAVGIGLSSHDWQAGNLGSGGRLQLAFVHPAPKAPSPEGRKAFRDEIRKEYGGRGGQPIGVFWEGMKPETISMTAADAQFIEGMKLNRIEICSIYRVPPHKIMDLDRATFSNIEQQSISYVTDAIRPWAVRWEQAISQRLLNGSGMFFAEHSMEGLLRGDVASRYAAYAIGRQWGWLSVNDIRNLENMNPVPKGDEYLQPLNMTELGTEPELKALPAIAEPDASITDEDKAKAARVLQHLRLM